MIEAAARGRGAEIDIPEASNHKPTWNVRIESDNMARHEMPICQEIGISYRYNYGNIVGASTGTVSETSTIYGTARAAAEEVIAAEARKVAALQAEAEARKLQSANKIPCTLCSEVFKSMMQLRNHLGRVHGVRDD